MMDAAPELQLTSTNVHQLVLASLTVATKWHSDECYSNEFYARAGGVALQRLNKLEAELIKRLDWSLAVSEEEFLAMLEVMCEVPRDKDTCRHSDCNNLCVLEKPVELSAMTQLLKSLPGHSKSMFQSLAQEPLKDRCRRRSSLSGLGSFLSRVRRTCLAGSMGAIQDCH
jgi:hypothetical protein